MLMISDDSVRIKTIEDEEFISQIDAMTSKILKILFCRFYFDLDDHER